MARSQAKPLIEIRGDEAAAVRSLKTLVNEYGRASTAINQSLELVKTVTVGVTKVVGGLTRAISAASKEALQFERAVAEVRTIADKTQFPLAKIEKISFDLAKRFGSDVTSNARALYQTISAGVTDATAATELLNQAQKLSIGGVTDITTAVSGLTSVLNAYKEQGLTAQQATDSLFVAVRDGTTTAGELAQNLGQVTSIAAQAGLSFQELLAAIATITQKGIGTAEAVTQVRSALIALTKETTESQEVAKRLGIEFDLNALRTKGLVRLMEDLVNQSGATEAELVKLFGRVEGYNAAVSLATGGSEVFAQKLAAQAEAAGASDEAMRIMNDTMDRQVQKFSALSNAAATAFGKVVTESSLARGAIDALNAGLRDLVNWLGKAEEQTRKETGLFRMLERFTNEFSARGGAGPGAAFGAFFAAVFSDEDTSLPPSADAIARLNGGDGGAAAGPTPSGPISFSDREAGTTVVNLRSLRARQRAAAAAARRRNNSFGRFAPGRFERDGDVDATSASEELAVADMLEEQAKRTATATQNITRSIQLMREAWNREFEAMRETLSKQQSFMEGFLERISMTMKSIADGFAGGIAAVMSQGIQHAVQGKEGFSQVLKEMTANMLTSIGTQLIAMGTSAALTQLLALIPWMQPLTGPPNAGAAAAAGVAIAAGGAMVAGGAALGGGSRGFRGVSPGFGGTGGRTQGPSRAGSRFEDGGLPPGLPGSGGGDVIVSVNFNGPVGGSPRRIGRQLLDSINQSLSLDPLRRGAFG